MTERDAETSALAGPAANAPATSAGVAALRADAGQEERGLRQEPPRLDDLAGNVAPTTAPTDERPQLADERLPQLAHELRDVLPEQASVREPHVLHVGAAGVRRLHEAEDARRPHAGRRRRTARASRARDTD